MNSQAYRFVEIACIGLGALVGCLIVLPLVATPGSSAPVPLLVAGTAAGAVIGYRYRGSRAFLYFSLVCILLLATVISFSTFQQ